MTFVLNNLELYLQSAAELPHELRRNFAQIRELDAKVQAMQEQLKEQQKVFLAAAREAAERGDEVDTSQLERMRERYREALAMSDTKTSLASAAYDLLDKHIRRLDQDLRKFEQELEQKELNMTAAERRKRKLNSGLSTSEQRKMFAGDGANFVREGRKARTGVQTGSNVSRSFDVALDMPIDPNEPTYCICSRVSFGEMVGCDNPECKREWFHFECVGLTANPKGKWLCPECSSLKRKQAGGAGLGLAP